MQVVNLKYLYNGSNCKILLFLLTVDFSAFIFAFFFHYIQALITLSLQTL